MKKILLTVISGCMVLASAASFSATAVVKTEMKDKWICTTNASSSDVAADQAADKKMSTDSVSAAKGFEFAAKNCRDCTKITCEAQK